MFAIVNYSTSQSSFLRFFTKINLEEKDVNEFEVKTSYTCTCYMQTLIMRQR